MISFVLATTGRPSLARAIASIDCWPGDEILVIGTLPAEIYHPQLTYVAMSPGHDWGHTERNIGTRVARGRYVAHLDDDDTYAPGHRARMADAIARAPGHPVLFRMQYPNGVTLWREPSVLFGNVGTAMMLLPNEPERFGVWGSFEGGDCHFLETMRWHPDQIVWRPEVIAHLGHTTAWAEQEAQARAC